MPVPRRFLRPPAVPTPFFERPALADRLAAGREEPYQATILVGPPGSGKTALATAHAGAAPGPVAWVTLAEADVVELVEAVCEALAIALPGFGDRPARLLLGEPDPGRLLRHVAGLVGNELEALAPEGVLLVLDGLDALADSPLALEWLEHLIAFFPPQGQLVLVGRALPPLKLASFRMAESLVELPPEAWTLDPAEAEAAFRLFGGAGEPPAQAAGWMGALARIARGSVQSARDYLRETWLARLFPERREALAALVALPDLAPETLATLPAARVEAALGTGDVLLARDAAGRPHLHPLLRELLGAGAGAPAPAPAPARLAELEHEAPGEALAAHLAAGDAPAALALVARQGPELAGRGALEKLERLLGAIPEPLRGAPAWQLAHGEVCRQRGQLDEAEAAFLAAEAGAGDDREVLGRALLGRAGVAGVRGGADIGALATRARDAFGDAHPAGRAAAEGLLGVHALYSGNQAGWRAHLGRALEGFRAVGDGMGAARALHNLALGHAHLGEHTAAIALYGEAVAACQAAGRLPFPLTHVNRAVLFAYAGERAAARADAELGLRLARERGLARDAAYGQWVLAKLHALEGRWSLALGLFEEALATGRAAGDALLQADALAGLAEVALRQGLPARAWELVSEGAALRGLHWSDPGLYELALVGGSTLATLGRRAEARAGLAHLAGAMAEREESPYRRARALAALAVVEDDPARAEDARARARALASEHGYPDPVGLTTPAPEAPAAEAAPTPDLAVRLFGRMEAEVDGAAVPPARWRGPRIRLLLAYLSFERAGATREQLESAFFGAADASRAAVALMIKRLREALEPDLAKSTLSRFVLFEDGRYMLDRARAIETDLDRFRHALDLASRAEGERAIALREEALDLYRGPLLAEFDDAWVEALREGARRQAMTALGRLTDDLIAAGRATDALTRAEALERRERHAEEPVMARMAALAALGRRDEARRAATDLGARLRRDLGVGPSEELEALLLRIMRGEWRAPARAEAARNARP